MLIIALTEIATRFEREGLQVVDVQVDFDATNWVFDLLASGGHLALTTDASGTSNKLADFIGNNKTGVANDEAYFSFTLDDDGGAESELVRLSWVLGTITAGSEHAWITLDAANGFGSILVSFIFHLTPF